MFGPRRSCTLKKVGSGAFEVKGVHLGRIKDTEGFLKRIRNDESF